MTNPLLSKHRIPKVYCELPSQMQFYPKDSVDVTINGEVAVYSLTVKDQILLKTPDALLNGDTLVKIIQNCVPGVKDATQLVEPDINTLMVAIRSASNGPMWSWDCVCPNCNTQLSYEFNLGHLIDSQIKTELNPVVNLQDVYEVKIRPFNFKQRHISIINEIEEGKANKILASKSDMDTDYQAKEMTKIINRISSGLLDLVSMSVVSVTILSTHEVVDDPEYIKEFVLSLSKNEADAISSKIKDLNKSGIESTKHFVCNDCAHEWDQNIDFDPTSFFD